MVGRPGEAGNITTSAPSWNWSWGLGWAWQNSCKTLKFIIEVTICSGIKIALQLKKSILWWGLINWDESITVTKMNIPHNAKDHDEDYNCRIWWKSSRQFPSRGLARNPPLPPSCDNVHSIFALWSTPGTKEKNVIWSTPYDKNKSFIWSTP